MDHGRGLSFPSILGTLCQLNERPRTLEDTILHIVVNLYVRQASLVENVVLPYYGASSSSSFSSSDALCSCHHPR